MTTFRPSFAQVNQIARQLKTYQEAAKVLSSDHPRMIDEHPCRWIGVYEGKVAARGSSLKSVLDQLRKKFIPTSETIIRYIDRQETLIL